MPKAKKTLGAVMLESESETTAETTTLHFDVAKAKLYDHATYAGTCLACNGAVPEDAPFAWYASGIITCLPCHDAGTPPDPKLVSAKLLAKAMKGGAKKPWHAAKVAPKATKAPAPTMADIGAPKTKGEAKQQATAASISTFATLVGAVESYVGPVPADDDEPTPSLVIKETQKVRGCRVLKAYGLPVPQYAVLPGEEHAAQALCATGNAFARPCQAKQEDEHGWIESRKVATYEEALAVLSEVHAVDPMAQVMVMPTLTAETSAIVTPAMCSVGAGHDAATSGKGAINLPVKVAFPQAWLDDAGIATSPYLEIVDAQCVQLRDGPKPSTCPDFFPADIECQQVITVTPETHADLTAFNKLAIEFGAMPGLVVHMPGGSPVSHYAAHCVLNNVAFATTFEPIVGATYPKTSDAFDAEAHRDAFIDGAASDLRVLGGTRADISGALAASILVIHQATTLLATPEGARLVGAACAGLYYATACACHGETRHHPKVKTKAQRHIIYEGAWANPLEARRTLPNALALFSDGSWLGSFGGKKWANATEEALKLWDAMVDVGRNGGKVADVIKQAHTLVNMAHNTGWLLNKFLGQTLMDQCAKGDPTPFVYVDDSHNIRHATTTLLYRMVSNPARLALDWSKMRQGRWKHSKARLADAKAEAEKLATQAEAEKLATKLANPPVLVACQANLQGATLHVQYKFEGDATYSKLDVVGDAATVAWVKRVIGNPKHAAHTTSLAGSPTPYAKLTWSPNPTLATEWSICLPTTCAPIATIHYTGGN